MILIVIVIVGDAAPEGGAVPNEAESYPVITITIIIILLLLLIPILILRLRLTLIQRRGGV